MSREMARTTFSELQLEQKFRLQVLRQDVKQLTLPEARIFIMELSKQLMLRENRIKDLTQSHAASE
ncbi:MAG: phycobilisome degradation protein NblA [Cyanobacteria bacterium J06639_1]